MRVLTAALKELIRLGVEGEALIAAIERLEAAAYEDQHRNLHETVDIAAAREDAALLKARRARDRERKRNVSTEIPRNSTETGSSPEAKVPGPLKTQTSPPTSPPSPPKGAHGSSPPSGFEAFWAAYPRKVGKPKAKAAYLAGLRRISGPDPPSVILAGLEAQLPGWSVREPDLIPHPTTWLNRDGWEDQPDQPNPRIVNGIRPHHNDAAQRSEDRMRRIFGGAEIAAGTRRHDFGG